MKFKVKGTKTILEPANEAVAKDYLARPEIYEPIGGEVKTDNPLANLSIDELKAYAADRKIDIGNATSANGIIKKILEAGGDPGDGGNG